MICHGQAVRRGVKHALVVIDLPFSLIGSPSSAIRRRGRALGDRRAGRQLSGGVAAVQALVGAGSRDGSRDWRTIGHALGGCRVEARGSGRGRLMRALGAEAAGAFSVVLESPAALATDISRALTVPTIGIGAGAGCDGQVLVLPDLLGLNEGFSPKFLRRYADLAGVIRDAVRAYAADVREGRYPGPEHGFD
jgi:3-methyl-2-oxobutanoate hydroxymethyltransferase